MLHNQIVENLCYILLLTGEFSDILEGVVLKIFCGQVPMAPFSIALLQFSSNILSLLSL